MQAFAGHILAWFEVYGRDLPWRRDRSPYRIWLCEIIMQQTRIAQGLAYWANRPTLGYFSMKAAIDLRV